MAKEKEHVGLLDGWLTVVSNAINVIEHLLLDRLSSWANSMIDKIVYPFWRDGAAFFATYFSIILFGWLVITYIGFALYNNSNWSKKFLLGKPITPGRFVKLLYICFLILIIIISLIGGWLIKNDDEPPITCKIDGCDTTDNKTPCWLTLTEEDYSSIKIAKNLGLNTVHAERIAELNRNENGVIKKLIAGEQIIVPSINFNEKRNIESLLCYLNELPLTVVFEECNKNADKSHYPCIYEIKEEIDSYAELAIDRYGESDVDIINDLIQANDFELFTNTEGKKDLKQLSTPFKAGTIVYIPDPE